MKPLMSLLIVMVLWMMGLESAQGEQRGIIGDPDGFVNLRAGSSTASRIIGKVHDNEPFTFEWDEIGEWCRIKLPNGKVGWMHHSRIRLYFTAEDLPTTSENADDESEIDQAARSSGLNYAKLTRAAAKGERDSLNRFFRFGAELDGAAAESLRGTPTAVYHLVGDEKFGAFLAAEPVDLRVLVRNEVLHDSFSMPTTERYLQRHFPRTFAVLIPDKIVAWTSPDKRYAVQKVFVGTPLQISKVQRAELIDLRNGKVVCDLTSSDIGVSFDREGGVLWSPDSQRFAYLSSDLTRSEGNLFSKPKPRPQRKQTVVFYLSDGAFKRVPMDLSQAPGSEKDDRLKGAVLGHEHTEPLKWERPDVLILQRHEYYEKLEPSLIGGVKFNQIKPFDRLFRINVAIGPNGTTRIDWKERDER